MTFKQYINESRELFVSWQNTPNVLHRIEFAYKWPFAYILFRDGDHGYEVSYLSLTQVSDNHFVTKATKDQPDGLIATRKKTYSIPEFERYVEESRRKAKAYDIRVAKERTAEAKQAYKEQTRKTTQQPVVIRFQIDWGLGDYTEDDDKVHYMESVTVFWGREEKEFTSSKPFTEALNWVHKYFPNAILKTENGKYDLQVSATKTLEARGLHGYSGTIAR